MPASHDQDQRSQDVPPRSILDLIEGLDDLGLRLSLPQDIEQSLRRAIAECDIKDPDPDSLIAFMSPFVSAADLNDTDEANSFVTMAQILWQLAKINSPKARRLATLLFDKMSGLAPAREKARVLQSHRYACATPCRAVP